MEAASPRNKGEAHVGAVVSRCLSPKGARKKVVVEGKFFEESVDYNLSQKGLLDPRKPGTLMALLLDYPKQRKCGVT